VVAGSLLVPAPPIVDHAEVAEGPGLPDQRADVPEQGKGPFEVLGGQLVLAEPPVRDAEPEHGLGLGGPVARSPGGATGVVVYRERIVGVPAVEVAD
jgi:hypothetical protein